MTENRQHELQTVLVVGAGNGGELAALRELGSRRLILTEAHPGMSTELSRRIDRARSEEVWPLAITAKQQPHATLHVCNNPRFSSLHPPRDLSRYFPNLRVTGEVEVPSRSFGEVLGQIIQPDDTNNLLVLGAAGQALELIHSVPANRLQSFNWIIFRTSAASMYDGDDAEACLATLKTIGFDTALQDPEAIYPDRTILLKRNDSRVHGIRQDARLQQITKERDEQAKLAAHHKADLDKAGQQATEQQKQAASMQAQMQKLTHERDEQTKLASQHKTDLEKVSQQAAEQQSRAADKQQELVSRQSELERSLQANAESNSALRNELATAKQTASLSVKLQTLREADLQDIQGRYRSLLEHYEVQRDLLMKLNEKLSAASNYFHLLSSESNSHNRAGNSKRRTKRITNRKGRSQDV